VYSSHIDVRIPNLEDERRSRFGIRTSICEEYTVQT